MSNTDSQVQEHSVAQATGDASSNRPEVLPQSPQDWLLEHFVRLAEYGGINLPVTLLVGGRLVSGTIGTGKRYFEALVQPFKDQLPDNEYVQNILVKGLESIAADVYHYEPDDPPQENPPGYIHLQGVRFFGTDGSSLPGNFAETWWRGKLAEVQGFTVGTLVPDKPKP